MSNALSAMNNPNHQRVTQYVVEREKILASIRTPTRLIALKVRDEMASWLLPDINNNETRLKRFIAASETDFVQGLYNGSRIPVPNFGAKVLAFTTNSSINGVDCYDVDVGEDGEFCVEVHIEVYGWTAVATAAFGEEWRPDDLGIRLMSDNENRSVIDLAFASALDIRDLRLYGTMFNYCWQTAIQWAK